jgi:hypothetical protein
MGWFRLEAEERMQGVLLCGIISIFSSVRRANIFVIA